MKVAFYLGMFPYLSETFILNQIVGMVDLGHDVTILAHGAPPDTQVQEDVTTYDLLRKTRYRQPIANGVVARWQSTGRFVAASGLGSTRRVRFLLSCVTPTTHKMKLLRDAELFRSGDYDIVHCHHGWVGAAYADLVAAGLADRPFLTSFHGIDLNFDVPAARYACLWKHGMFYTCNTEFMARRAVELGCQADRITIIHESVKIDRFPFTKKTRSERPFRILSIARLTEAKGIHVAIEAISLLTGRNLNCEYHVVGAGPLRSELEELARKFGVSERVVFHGALTRSEIVEEFAASDVFVLPSIRSKTGLEGQGVVLQEAQACGLPVIASRAFGMPEGVLDGESGFLFEPGDPAALAENLEKLIHDRELLSGMGARGRRFVEERFSADVLNLKLQDLYRTIAGARSQPLHPSESAAAASPAN